MVHLHLVGKQKIEPVGVAELSSPKVSIASSFCVLQAVCARHRVVSTQLLEHIAINTRILGIYHIVELQPTFVVHFLVNAHHLLRVHDVIVVVAWLEACRELACIVHAGMTFRTSLGRNDNHTTHGASTINGCCRTVLEDCE